MAVPAFGFSVGDFITRINLAIDVVNACRDTGRVSSQYEKTLVEFKAYLAILRRLQDPTVSTNAVVNSLASSCEGPVNDFMAKVEKYKASLAKSTVSSMHTFPRKAQWALVAKKAVDELKSLIAVPLCAISVELVLENRSVYYLINHP